EATPQPADALSVVLSVVGFGPLVYGLTGIGGDSGAAATGSSGPGPDALIALGVGVVSLALFVWRQTALQKRDRALLDLRTFAVRNFSVAVVLMVVMMGAMFGTVVLLPIYLQLVLGLSTLTVGAMMLPGGLVMGLAAPAVGRMFDRVGPRPLLTPGLGLVVVGILVMSTVGTDTSPLVIVGGHLVMSCGLALVFTPLLTTALGSLPKSLYPHGSAMVGTVQQVAGAAGGAMLVALMSRIAAGVEADGGSHAQGIAAGTSVAFLVSAVLGVVTIAISLFIRRNPQHGAAPADQPEPELQPEPMAATDAGEASADSVAEQLGSALARSLTSRGSPPRRPFRWCGSERGGRRLLPGPVGDAHAHRGQGQRHDDHQGDGEGLQPGGAADGEGEDDAGDHRGADCGAGALAQLQDAPGDTAVAGIDGVQGQGLVRGDGHALAEPHEGQREGQRPEGERTGLDEAGEQ